MTKEEYSVTILARQLISTYPKLGEEVKVWHITYVAAGLPPSTIRIPEKEYSEKRAAELIRKDIETRLKQKPERITV